MGSETIREGERIREREGGIDMGVRREGEVERGKKGT